MTSERQRGWILRGLAIQSAGLSVALSLAFFLSGPERVSGSAYSGVVQTGGPRIWGVVFLFVGALVAIASAHGILRLRAAMVVAALAYGTLAGTFVYAAITHPSANLTAPVVYAWLAYAHLFVAGLITYKLHHVSGE